MARMSSDDERKSVKYGDSSQLTNLILDSGETCDMTPEVLNFIPESLEDTEEKEKARAVDVSSKKIRNVHLGNILDVDLKITRSKNVPSHQKIMRNGEGKYFLM